MDAGEYWIARLWDEDYRAKLKRLSAAARPLSRRSASRGGQGRISLRPDGEILNFLVVGTEGQHIESLGPTDKPLTSMIPREISTRVSEKPPFPPTATGSVIR